MATWLVRAGKTGEFENLALESGIALVGWSDAGDLSNIKSKQELLELFQKTWPDAKPKTLANWSSQVWQFIGQVQPGDTVALPLKSRPNVVFGRVKGTYQFVPNAPHDAKNQLPVEWLPEIPRSAIAKDILYSLGAFLTVCRISRNDADIRIQKLIEGGKMPLPGPSSIADEADLESEEVDLASIAMDQIRSLINAKLKGHGLSRLVAGVLEAQGYKTVTSPEGPDGGVDVLAGSGPLGFESPRIVVQVKSEQSPIDVKVVRELQGVMKSFGADHGMVVAWGGFKPTVIRENSRQAFEIRLWNSDDLISAVLEHYEHLSDDLRAELPLRRIWTVVPEVE